MVKRYAPLFLVLAACGSTAGADILAADPPEQPPTGQATGQEDAGSAIPPDPPPGQPDSGASVPDAATDSPDGSDAGQDSAADSGADAGPDSGQDADAGPPPPTRYGVSFDRASLEYLSAPYPSGLIGSTTVTAEGWFYVRQPTDEGRFFQAYGFGCSYANSVAYGPMRGHINCLAGTTGPQNQVFSQQPCPLGQWFHLAFVLSGGTFTMYVDGKSQGTATPDFGPAVPGFNGVRVKWGGTGAAANETLDGVADEVRLSATADYAGDFVPPAHLPSPGFLLDEGAGDPTALDGTSGALTGGPTWTTVSR